MFEIVSVKAGTFCEIFDEGVCVCGGCPLFVRIYIFVKLICIF